MALQAAEWAEDRNLAQAQVLEAQNGRAPLTLRRNPEATASSGPEPIPTQWPHAKLEPIPTQWKATVVLVGGAAARATGQQAGKAAGTRVVPK